MLYHYPRPALDHASPNTQASNGATTGIDRKARHCPQGSTGAYQMILIETLLGYIIGALLFCALTVAIKLVVTKLTDKKDI